MIRTYREVPWLRFSLVLLIISTVLNGLSATSAYAAGVVGSGTPASCTEAALDVALSGGGLVTFNCGPAPHTIILSYTKQIAEDTEIEGNDLITLSGGNATSHFQVFFDKTLTLRNLTLSRATGTYGAIENFGTLHLVNSQVTLNNATDSGGAINNYGETILENATLADNNAAQFGGAIYNDSGRVTITDSLITANRAQGNSGGGIWSSGTITVTNSVLSDNQAAYQGGGGIFNTGSLQLSDVTFEDNVVAYAGPANGGGLNHSAGLAQLNGVTFRGNSSNTYGGGLYIGGGSLSATGSLFSGNQAVVGGAVSNSGTFTLTHSLVYSNTAASTGAIANGLAGVMGATNAANLVNVTISHNTSGSSMAAAVQSDNGSLALIHATIADNQGGGGLGRGSMAGQLQIKNTIVANNLPQNCLAAPFSNGFNIAGDSSCLLTAAGDMSNTDPLLDPLADNGGPTLTYMPQPGSPAIDGGQCVAGILTDQRGQARLVGAACDVGAVEVGDVTPDPSSFVYLPLVLR